MSFGELLLIALAFIIFFDNEKMPELMRAIGSFIAKTKRVLFDARNEVSEVMNEAYLKKEELLKPLQEPIKEVKKLHTIAKQPLTPPSKKPKAKAPKKKPIPNKPKATAKKISKRPTPSKANASRKKK